MPAAGLGKQSALLTIHGDRLGITAPDINGNCQMILDGINVGGPSGFQIESGAGAVVALAGGGQSSNTPVLTAMANRLATVATTSDSVMLPATAGAFTKSSGQVLRCTVINQSSAGLAAAVFPSSGDAINSLAANASIAVSSATVKTFYAFSSGKWYSN